jgi:hypothetical protein
MASHTYCKPVNQGVGDLRVCNREFWGTLTVKDPAEITSLRFTPGTSGMAVLDAVGAVYNYLTVNSIRVTIIGTAPSTSKSVAYLCLDYVPARVTATKAGVLSTIPNVTVPGYSNGMLVANKTSLQFVNSTTMGVNTTAFLLTAWLQGNKDDKWQVYCDYDVEFRKSIAERINCKPFKLGVGTLRVRNREFWGTLTVKDLAAKTSLKFSPGTSGMIVLDAVGSVYVNFKVHSARVTIIGTAPNTSKSVAYLCFVYVSGREPATQVGVCTTKPNVTVPGHGEGTLNVDKKSVQNVNWVTPTATAFLLTAWLQGDKDDEWQVHCEYDVEFKNPASS